MSARHEHTTDPALAPILDIFRYQSLAVFKARPEIRPWAEASGVLVPSAANRMLADQPYNFAYFCPIASLIFGFFEGPDRELHLMKDTQAGASTTAFWAIAWTLAWDPGNVIFITKGRDSAKNAGQDRMDHIFEKIPQLGRSKNDGIPDSTAMVRRFPGGALYMGGCDSVTQLIGQPAARVLLDEIKEHRFIDGKSTVDLARMRIKMDSEGKIFAFSTAGDAVEYVTDRRTGRTTPISTPESLPHLEYLSGTQEQCHVPCPHCGHYQPLEFERLRFMHCKEPAGDGEEWNYAKVAADTWYQCANPDCTDRNPDGTVRGRIDERHKYDMMQRHKWVAQNSNPKPGRRSATISVLYNVVNPVTSSWGQVAIAFLDAHKKGTSEAMKAFHTDWLGKPWTQFRLNSASLNRVYELKGGFRWKTPDGKKLTNQIPWKTDETWFCGGLVDVQSDHVKWLVQAVSYDGRAAVVDHGICGSVDEVPDVMRGREFECKEETEGRYFPVIAVWMDVNGIRRSELYQKILGWRRDFPEIMWEGIVGRDSNQTRQVQIASHQRIEYNVLDEAKRPMLDESGNFITIPVNNIDAAYWESELYGECIFGRPMAERIKELMETDGASEAEATAHVREARRVWLPLDTPEAFCRELCNMKQALKPVGHSGHQEHKWVKINKGPNDYGDLCKYGQVMIYVARQDGW